jgi:hypothetical protein
VILEALAVLGLITPLPQGDGLDIVAVLYKEDQDSWLRDGHNIDWHAYELGDHTATELLVIKHDTATDYVQALHLGFEHSIFGETTWTGRDDEGTWIAQEVNPPANWGNSSVPPRVRLIIYYLEDS